MRRPLIVAAAVAVLGFLFVGQGFTTPSALCYGEWHWTDSAAFPPGATTCHKHVGQDEVTKVVMPWGDWLTVLLVAASAGLFVAALESRRRRIVRAAGAYVLFLAAAFAWFVASSLVWVPLAAVFATAVAASVRGRPPTPA